MKNIYIILTQTGTIVSSLIQRYTGDPYNHASIAFDRSLKVMYSFGRKHRYNLFNNGFVEENLNQGLFAVFPKAKCLVLELGVDDDQFDAMQKWVNVFVQRRDMYRYNTAGLLGYMLGVPLGRKDRYFCSQFVASVLGTTQVWARPPGLTKPMDFTSIMHKTVVYEGTVWEYNIQQGLRFEPQSVPTMYKRLFPLLYCLTQRHRFPHRL
ncbi:MAG TPA: hypothetical protein VJ036_08000 [bacterium]|jgi:hypothetical protein|nr:hypothetical protein [bacterium]